MFKKMVYGIWVLCCAILIIEYCANGTIFGYEKIEEVLLQYGSYALVVYILISFIRGFFLIPSTPFVIGGALFFPSLPFMILIISMLGVIFSASLLFFYSDTLGFSEKFENRYPQKMKNITSVLNKPRAIMYVATWAVFPLVPTDIICYVAGLVKMKYSNLILGIFCGELILNICFIYSINFFGDFISIVN